MLVALLLGLLQALRRVAGAGDGVLVDRDVDVTGLHAQVRRWAVGRDLGDDDTLDLALKAELLARRAIELAELETERARLLRTDLRLTLALVVAGDFLLVGRHLADIDLHLLVMAVAPDGDVSLAVDRRLGNQPRQIVQLVDLVAVELDDDVALLDAGTRRRAVRVDVGDERAALARHAEAAGDLGRHLLDLDAQPAAIHLAVLAQLRDDGLGEVGRNGEADADAAAIRRVDRGIDADHLTLLGKGRATGIAAVDRRVEL